MTWLTLYYTEKHITYDAKYVHSQYVLINVYLNSAITVIAKVIVTACKNKKVRTYLKKNMFLALYISHQIHQIPDL